MSKRERSNFIILSLVTFVAVLCTLFLFVGPLVSRLPPPGQGKMQDERAKMRRYLAGAVPNYCIDPGSELYMRALEGQSLLWWIFSDEPTGRWRIECSTEPFHPHTEIIVDYSACRLTHFRGPYGQDHFLLPNCTASEVLPTLTPGSGGYPAPTLGASPIPRATQTPRPGYP